MVASRNLWLNLQATLKLMPEQVGTIIAARAAFEKGIKSCTERWRSRLDTLVAPLIAVPFVGCC